jgi:SET and MYND domain-containing protein
MRITAVKRIAVGEEISINYGEHCRPFASRQAHLLEKYWFVCTCPLCGGESSTQAGLPEPPLPLPLSFTTSSYTTVMASGPSLPDRVRAFVCRQEDCTGAVCPLGDGADATSWCCSEGCRVSAADVHLALAAEVASGVVSELASEAKPDESLHYSHHLWMEYFNEQIEGMVEEGDPKSALPHMNMLLMALDLVLPQFHRSKVTELDRLGYLWVLAGDLVQAKEAYRRALEMSIVVFGAASWPTVDCRRRFENPAEVLAELERGGDEGDSDEGDSDEGDEGDEGEEEEEEKRMEERDTSKATGIAKSRENEIYEEID